VLGIDPTQECLTVTGGLPFFGGPGNNYSSHGIATLVQSLCKDRGAYGLVLANGGFMSKESSGIYSTNAPDDWSVIDNRDD
jgi:acetyl-CoA C-acetyltransferase